MLEVNFDGMVGPTHHYGGLSFGNIASTSHSSMQSNPKEAALQGLEKMKFVSDLGIPQAVLPPHERPHLPTLRRLGFRGTDPEILEKANTIVPEILGRLSSAASMWTANAATVAPSPDTQDGRLHLTVANLINKFHRSIEAETTERILKSIFSDDQLYAVHSALPSTDHFGDEGAANHTRFCENHESKGIHFFVYGRTAFAKGPKPSQFPARQTQEASEAIARTHLLDPSQVVFAQQNPAVIDAGVFHNDVIAVGNEQTLFFHEEAFLESDRVLQALQDRIDLNLVLVTEKEVPVQDAVKSYLFNSQLLTLPSGEMALVAPTESQESRNVFRCLERVRTDSSQSINQIFYRDVRQSMNNGGGPACLRLRVVMSEKERKGVDARVFLDETLYQELRGWVQNHYRDRLKHEDLADPLLLDESRQALDELTRILDLGSVYDFQV